MKRRSLFGSRLYGQIVYPLLAASVVVGIVATFVAVYFLQDLTGRWVSEVARNSTDTLATSVSDYAGQMERMARIAVADGGIRSSVARLDDSAMRAAVVIENTNLGFDSMMLLDPQGRVVAITGAPGVNYGARPFGDEGAWGYGRPRTTLSRLGNEAALSALYPVSSGRDGYTLVASRVLDDAFLESLGVGEGSAYCIYDAAGRRIACAIGPGLNRQQEARLSSALTSPAPEIGRMLGEASREQSASADLRLQGGRYQLWSERIRLPGEDSGRRFGYVVGAVSQNVSAQAGATTRNLIAMWSIVAVVALVGLGGWVARRVSDPLVELAAGARRIADGDFSTKVEVAGANEVAELADSFNIMTDSLRERSESLTKKVLELATLYEMSRALGSTLDMDELLGSVLDSALRIFDLDLGYVVLRDKETGELGIRALRGVASAADGAVRSSMSEWVVREGRPLIFNPDAGSGDGQIDAITGAKAALCVPLVSAEGTIGSITIGSSDLTYRLTSDDVRLLSTIANHVTIAVGNIELFSSLQEAYLATVRSLAAAVDAKDTYTRGHSDRVAHYAVRIAERMKLSHDQRVALEMAAYLHDIGKIGVAEDILLKPGRLDDGEMTQMRHHPLIGANILKPVAFPWAITPVVRHHHEAYDGSGYPAGLRGEEIPLLARILTVADSFEAMTADRPYRKGMSVSLALQELDRCSGSQFDPRVVGVFSSIAQEEVDALTPPEEIATDEVAPEEARAIFAAIVDGVFASFRRLGGPRLAANVEKELDVYFAEQGTQFRVVRGRLVFESDTQADLAEELDVMRDALRHMDAVIGELSGGTLVEHFYNDALAGLSARMRETARELGFYRV